MKHFLGGISGMSFWLCRLLGCFLFSNAFIVHAQPTNCVTPPAGQVAWWRAETNANDQIGGYHGTLLNGTSFGAGKVGLAFAFDGVVNYITNNVPGLSNLLNTYTTEFWAFPNAARESTVEATSGNFGTENQRYAVFPHNGRFGPVGSGISVGTNGVSVFEHGSAYTPALLVFDTNIVGWTHVAVVYSNRVPRLFLNGSLVRTGLTSSRDSYPSTLLGEGGADYGYYAGLLDEVSIYNRALGGAEILSIYNAGTFGKCLPPVTPFIIQQPTNQIVQPGGVATFSVAAGGTAPLSYQWRLNGTNLPGATTNPLQLLNVQPNQAGLYSVLITNLIGSTNSLDALLIISTNPACALAPSGLAAWWPGEGTGDDIASTNDGALQNGVGFITGKVGQSFSFDGINDGVIPPSVSLPNILDNYTMEFWARPNRSRAVTPEANTGISGTSGQRYAIFPNMGPPVGAGVSVGTNGVSVFEHNPIYLASPLVYDAPLLDWTHIAVVYSNRQPRLYLNGALVRVGLTGTAASCPSTVLGGRIWAGQDYGFYSGDLDEVSIYNRALPAAEIQAIYGAQSIGKCFALEILTQPSNQSTLVGGSAIFTVEAAGTPPLSYQWIFNGTNLPGATASSLVLNNVQTNQAGIYSVFISSLAGSTNSANASLVVNPASSCPGAPLGLVAWWPGQNSADDIVGTNHGILQGGVTFTPGKVNQAFSFDGINDGVFNNNTALTNIIDNYTIEFWAKPNQSRATTAETTGGLQGTSGAQRYAVFPHFGGDGPVGAGVSVGTNGVSVFEHTGDYLPSLLVYDTPITDWTHIAVVYSNRQPRLYLNGTLVRVGLTSILSSSPSTVLGGRLWVGLNYGFYGGLLDEVSIYNRSLTLTEIQNVYAGGSVGKCLSPSILLQPVNQTVVVGESVSFNVIASGMVPLSYQWSFNGTNLPGATQSTLSLTNVQTTRAGSYSVQVSNPAGVTNSAAATLTVILTPNCTPAPTNLISWWRAENNNLDQAGGNHGTLVGNVTYGPGRTGLGFVLDGDGDAIQVGNPENLRRQDFSIEAWIRRSSASAVSVNGPLGMIFAYGANGYGLYLDPSGVPTLSKINVSATSPSAASAIVDTNFHHLVVTKSIGIVVFYVDGQAYSAPSYNPGFTFTTVAQIGAWSASQASSFLGTIDELTIYGRALAANEVQALYNANLSGKCLLQVPPSIVSHPTNQTVTVGQTANFFVHNAGTPPFAYQWLFNGNPIPGATSSTLGLPNAQANQSGAYSVAITNQFGSVVSSNATLTVNFPPAQVRVTTTNSPAGTTAAVPVVLQANGNENAIAFSLTYNSGNLSFAGATAPAGASLLINTTSTNLGRVGLGIALAPGATFNAGTQEIVRVHFNAVNPSASSSTVINFGDQPTLRQLLSPQLNVLPVNYSSGTLFISGATAYEGDVFPRPTGDTNTGLSDWLLLGRYASRLDYPTNAAEFQRADCAPRAPRGNGSIRVSDWVQAGRYGSGLEPLTPIGGPNDEVLSSGAGPSATRLVSVDSVTVMAGEPAIVGIRLAAQGNENALGFTLSFNPSLAGFIGASLAPTVTGATLIVNTNELPAGRIGILLAAPTTENFGIGTRELVRISFQSLGSGSFAPSFLDLLVPREVSDAAANALPVSYVNGTVTVTAPLTLKIARSGGNVRLSWPLSATNFNLQEQIGLNQAGSWSNVVVPPSASNDEHIVVLPLSSTNRFYRLMRP